MKTAFSTVACPDWTLGQVMSFADEVEFDGVELRTFGWGSHHHHRSKDRRGGAGAKPPEWGSHNFACDPALTDGAKVRRMAQESGTRLMCLGTSVKFDDPIWPPVLGRVLASRDRSIESAKRFLRLADDLECPLVRVFGFESPGGERRSRTLDRVVQRLGAVLDTGRSRRIRVVFENGGSFARAEDVAEVIRECGSPWLGAAYNVAVGARAGDSAESAIDLLGERLWTVKLKDLRGRRPVEIGQGEMPLRRSVEHLVRSGYGGWVVVEWMKYWVPDLGEPEGVLRRSMDSLQRWIAAARAPTVGREPAPAHA